MKVPTIYEIVESEVQSIRDREEKLKQFEKNPLNYYICNSLKKEIEDRKKILEKFKQEMRVEKLKQLGI